MSFWQGGVLTQKFVSHVRPWAYEKSGWEKSGKGASTWSWGAKMLKIHPFWWHVRSNPMYWSTSPGSFCSLWPKWPKWHETEYDQLKEVFEAIYEVSGWTFHTEELDWMSLNVKFTRQVLISASVSIMTGQFCHSTGPEKSKTFSPTMSSDFLTRDFTARLFLVEFRLFRNHM